MRTGKAGRAFFILSCAWTALAVAGRLPHLNWISPIGAASAQEVGHDDGNHTGGPGSGGHADGDHDDATGHDTDGDGDEGGGHTGGQGAGHAGGAGGHGATLAAVDEDSGGGSPKPPKPTGSFRDPDYFRLELGLSAPRANNAYWLPEGYPSDPKVLFNLDLNRAGFGSLALGHYWGGGLRSEVALSAFGTSSFTTTSTTTVPPTPGTHASMTGNTSSVAIMANGYYTPYIPQLGSVQPYVSAGIGVSGNTMGNWTRTNATKGTPVRSFEGATNLALAASLGVGLSIYLGEVSGKPTSVDLGYRYYDLGNVSGSATPLPGSGSGSPVKPLNFNKSEQVVSLSLRVWF